MGKVQRLSERSRAYSSKRRVIGNNKVYLTKVINDIKAYCADTCTKLPYTAIEYDAIAVQIHKHHRATLTANSISFSKDIKPIFYPSKDLSISATGAYLADFCSNNNLTYKVHVPIGLINRRTSVTLICNTCGFTESLTVTSAIRRKNGCKKCESVVAISLNPEKLLAELNVNNFSIVSSISSIKAGGRIDIVCNNCLTVSNRTVSHILYRKGKVIHCNNCNPSHMYGRQGVSSLFNGIEFDSLIEANAYKLLNESFTNIKCHTKYTDLGIKNTQFISDFILDNDIIEVSSFNEAHHKDYFNKIALKHYLVESQTKYTFIFCNSLADVNDFINTYKFLLKI